MNTIYIISGPLGVGKTSVAKELQRLLPGSVLVVGDDFLQALDENSDLSWVKKLELSWKQILTST